MSGVNLSVTATAVSQINSFMAERQPIPAGVRIFVYSDEGGHVNYGMNFVDAVCSSDIMFSIAGVTFVTDAGSAIFLNGIMLDFVQVGSSQGFVFKNECLTKNCANCDGSCGRVQ
jgi:iron-sulfur cluster assembly accessory protein